MSRRDLTVALGSWTRRNGFWLADRVRGGRVRRNHEEVRAGAEEGRPPTGDALVRLLDHATTTTSFYAPYAGLDLDGFPVIDRGDLKRDEPAFRSRDFEGARLHHRRSSGSTGEPLVLAQDQDKRDRATADTIVFNELAGLRLGDPLMWLFGARVAPMPRRQRWMQNIVPIDHVGLDSAAGDRVIQILRRGRIRAVLGISSTFLTLARHIEAAGIDPAEFRLNVVVTSGETLLPAISQRIAAAFGCPVVDRYATEELGLLACARPGSGSMYLNHASFRFEFLRLDADEPGTPGGLARIVVTDLYNQATPMIRYDTGDLAIVDEVDETGEVAALRSVEGRRADLIHDTSGGQVSSTSVSGIMVRAFPAIDRYQLIQDDARSYQLKVVQAGAGYGAAQFVEELRKWLGADARVNVQIVASIPPLASGKHRAVIGAYQPPRADPG